MDSKRLKLVEDVYHEAADLPPEDLPAFLRERCGNDAGLRREVESLLSFDSTPDCFLDGSAGSLAAEMFSKAADTTDLSDGTIGHYRVISKIGTGGMGVVYLAQDTKLGRKVAIKFLNKEFSNDDSKLQRFIQEAKAASALNHPNILTVFEIGEADDTSYIVTEWIDGSTWREHLDETDSPRLKAVLDTAVQVAEALAAAHSAGITHRDIKPENIMVRRDGYAKILDFGLAKLAEEPGFIGSENKTRTAVKTRSGIIMGTVSYMSPEQARGKKTDTRTDLWSLGVVIYEMLTGQLPFRGETMSDTVASILTETPERLANLASNVPDGLQQILDRSFAKKVEDRYQTAWELRADLIRVLRDSETEILDNAFTNETVLHTVPSKSNWWTKSSSVVTSSNRWALWLIAPLLLLALAGGVYWTYSNASAPAATRFQSTKLDVLTAHGLAKSVAISPDGKYIVYTKDEDGKESLWLRQTASVGDTQIAQADQTKYDHLRFSRDGNFLYVVATEAEGQPASLFQMTALGRNRRKVINDVDSQISFSPDGAKVAFLRIANGEYSIIISDAEGGNERILITRKHPKVYGDEVSWSPDGRLIAAGTLTRGEDFAGGIATIDVASGVETPLPLSEKNILRTSRVAWTSDGKGLVYSLYAALMGQRYQLRYAAFPSGEVQNVSNDLSSYEDYSLTADSQMIVGVKREYSMGIWLTPPDDFLSAVGINSKTGADDGERGVSWTTDGKIVFVSSEGGAQNIWRMDADGDNPKPLTADYKTGKVLPTRTLGSDTITFLKQIDSRFGFFQMDSDGQNLKSIVEDEDLSFVAATANKDWLVYTRDVGGPLRIWKIPIGGGEPVKLTNVESSTPVISNDGKFVAYFDRTKGKPLSLSTISIDGGEPIKTFELPSTAIFRAGLAWNKNDTALLFVNTLGTTSNVWIQPVNGSKAVPLTSFKEFQIAAFALNAEGNRLAIARGSRTKDVVLIKNIGK